MTASAARARWLETLARRNPKQLTAHHQKPSEFAMATPNRVDFPAQPVPAPEPPTIDNLQTLTERWSLHVPRRLLILPPTAVVLGAVIGMSRGGTRARLRFLAENAHRQPTTIQGWVSRDSAWPPGSEISTLFAVFLHQDAELQDIVRIITRGSKDWFGIGRCNSAVCFIGRGRPVGTESARIHPRGDVGIDGG